jgi:hypothetical protein
MSPKGVNELMAAKVPNSNDDQSVSANADAPAEHAGAVSRGGSYGAPEAKMFSKVEGKAPEAKMFSKVENQTYPEIERFIANHLRIIGSTCENLAKRELASEATVSQGGQSTFFGNEDGGAKAGGYMPELTDTVKEVLGVVESGKLPDVDVSNAGEIDSGLSSAAPGA